MSPLKYMNVEYLLCEICIPNQKHHTCHMTNYLGQYNHVTHIINIHDRITQLYADVFVTWPHKSVVQTHKSCEYGLALQLQTARLQKPRELSHFMCFSPCFQCIASLLKPHTRTYIRTYHSRTQIPKHVHTSWRRWDRPTSSASMWEIPLILKTFVFMALTEQDVRQGSQSVSESSVP